MLALWVEAYHGDLAGFRGRSEVVHHRGLSSSIKSNEHRCRLRSLRHPSKSLLYHPTLLTSLPGKWRRCSCKFMGFNLQYLEDMLP